MSEGSSPLARGLLSAIMISASGSGIIPARAGFTRPSPGSTCGREDHPRSRGVYAMEKGEITAEEGSSPLARGLQSAAWQRIHERGIIPARAGFTWLNPFTAGPTKDHPRSRGVYLCMTHFTYWKCGSSPLARGLHNVRVHQEDQAGIIPARAGFTSYTSETRTETRGSSPLARGLLRQLVAARHLTRIIPARAGFTRPRPPGRSWSTDHPRSRGVYATRSVAAK